MSKINGQGTEKRTKQLFSTLTADHRGRCRVRFGEPVWDKTMYSPLEVQIGYQRLGNG